MNHLLRQQQLETAIACDSAGTSSYHIGSAPDRRMTAAACSRGIEMKGSARQFIAQDFEDFDLILAMDKANYRDILSLDPHHRYKSKVKLMADYALNHRETEVPDPYYGGPDGFNQVMELLQDACEGLLTEICQVQAI